jgi:hypothetical protein
MQRAGEAADPLKIGHLRVSDAIDRVAVLA